MIVCCQLKKGGDALDKARVTITIRGKELEVIDAIAKSSGKLRGDVVAEIFHEVMEGILPVLEADSESQAMKLVFRAGLNKLAAMLDEPIG